MLAKMHGLAAAYPGFKAGGANGIVPHPPSAVMRSYQNVSRDSRTHTMPKIFSSGYSDNLKVTIKTGLQSSVL